MKRIFSFVCALILLAGLLSMFSTTAFAAGDEIDFDELMPPAITKEPEDVFVASGATASTTVETSGKGLSYTWYFKDVDKSAFSKSSITTNTYSMKMENWRSGQQVYCVIQKDGFPSVTTRVATLGILPQITKQPANASGASGAKVTTSLTATGDGLKYQWYFKNKGDESWTKASATGSSYSVTMSSTTNGQQAYCKITDKYGNTVKSSAVTLTMKNVAKITKQPANVTVANGKAAKVSVTATGDGLKYQWYFKNKGAESWTKASATGSSYSVTMSKSVHGQQVYCKITDKYSNTVKSSVVTLTMKNAVKITKQPVNAAAPNGSNIKVSVTATGDGLKYQWYYKDGNYAYGKSSNTTNSYSTTMNAERSTRKVYCLITDKYGNKVKTKEVSLSMNNGKMAKITKQPAKASAANGKTVKVSVTATGDGLKYQWYFKNKGATAWSKASATGSSYSVTMSKSVNGQQVYCKITDKYGNTVKSNAVALSMTSPKTVKITKQPVKASAANGKTVKVSVTATGDGLKYQWYYKNKGDTSWTKASATGSSYSVTMSKSVHGRQVLCKITDKYGNTVKSSAVTLTMQNTVKITKQPANASAANGKTIKVSVTATGDGLKYQWYYKDGNYAYGKSSNTTNTYSTTMNAERSTRKVYCVITDKYGNKVKTKEVSLSMK